MILYRQKLSQRNKRVRIQTQRQNGFTLIEVIIGIAVFAIITVGVYSSFNALKKATRGAREQTILSSLSSQYLEVVRNMPYDNIGTENGNPNGVLADESDPIVSNIEGETYNAYYEITYIDDSADGTILAGTDVSPNDYKQVKLVVEKMSTSKITTYITNVSPQGLEGLSNAGALYLSAIDANGQPIAGANFHIESLNLTPDIILDRTSDSSGNWIEVGLPATVNGYRIIVTKNGYSTDSTYPITVANPNPTKPDATVVNGAVTQIAFAIDFTSNLTIRTVNETCQNISGIDMNLRGAKLIGMTPSVLKYDQDHTSSAGQIALNAIEWDTYTPTLLTGQSYTVYGTSPIQEISVLPAASQTFTIVLGPDSTDSLLVIVKDSATGTAIEGATVSLHDGGTPADYSGVTGGSVWQQSDWSTGAGQSDWVDSSQYFTDDNNVNINTIPNGVRLASAGSNYASSGWLESSTFDTGGSSNFTTVAWQPTSQNPATTLKFQIASNNDNLTWNYLGPDGTASTYYTVSGSNISNVHDNNQYIRYKVFVNTTDSTFTPVLTSIGINYVSGCFTPGQVIFPGLTAGNDFDLTVSMPGYTTYTEDDLNVNGNQIIEVLMSP